MKNLSLEEEAKLQSRQNIWFASVRPDGRPHLTPVWFVWHEGKIYVGIDPNSVKTSNIRQNPRVALALEDGSNPIICEGHARILQGLPEDGLLAAFHKKYEWDLTQEQQFNLVVEVTPVKWLSW